MRLKSSWNYIVFKGRHMVYEANFGDLGTEAIERDLRDLFFVK